MSDVFYFRPDLIEKRIIMNSQTTSSSNIDSRSKQNTQSLALWTALWLVSLALVAFGPKFLWEYNVVISLVSITINLGMGYKMIIANKVFLQGCDELQQRIQLEAMALSLGVSMVFGAVFGLVHAIKLVDFHPNPSSILFVMGLTYAIGTFLGHRKYL
jgi:hypothetical protein